MFANLAWLVWLTLTVCANGNSTTDTQREHPVIWFPSKNYSGKQQSSRTLWSQNIHDNYRLKDDSRRLTSEATSHGYGSYPYGSTLKTTESFSDHPSYAFTSQEYWRPNTANSNYTGTKLHAYSRPYYVTEGVSYQDPVQGSHSMLQYQQMRATTMKKFPAYILKGKVQVTGSETSGIPKYKKTVFYQAPPTYKKAIYPRVHKPYAKHKYPTQKTIPPFYRRYYQSPYQQYAIPLIDTLHQKAITQNGHTESHGYQKVSVAYPTPTSDRHHTTERMDGSYSDGQKNSEDYAADNDTYIRPVNENYYETYEEGEKIMSESQENSFDETTTRGYYGDRIYMSTQTPINVVDKTATRNNYYLVRRTSNDDDIETIFE